MRRFIGVDVGVNTNIYDWLQLVTIGYDWCNWLQLVTILRLWSWTDARADVKMDKEATTIYDNCLLIVDS